MAHPATRMTSHPFDWLSSMKQASLSFYTVKAIYISSEPDLHHSSLISPDRWSSSPDERLHVLILDKPGKRYQVPTLLFPRPAASNSSTIPFEKSPHPLVLTYETDPFSFTVSRRSTHEVLFSTKSHPLIFRDKHLQIATQQSPHSNIYGLGESTDTFKINLEGNGTRRTMW